MFQRLNNWFRRLMYGRYGSDKLNLALLCAAMVVSVVCSFVRAIGFLHVISYVLLGVALYRTFSRNIAARRREEASFRRFLKLFSDRSNRYYGCPTCGQTVRVPRGKGRICIHCPRCGERFEKRT